VSRDAVRIARRLQRAIRDAEAAGLSVVFDGDAHPGALCIEWDGEELTPPVSITDRRDGAIARGATPAGSVTDARGIGITNSHNTWG
jgi:hypothetical protein